MIASPTAAHQAWAAVHLASAGGQTHVSPPVNWVQIGLGGLTGALLAFFLARALDLYRNRPRLLFEQGDVAERLYVHDRGRRGDVRLVVASPADPAAQLVVSLDVLCINNSYQPDGVISADLWFLRGDRWEPYGPTRARLRADEPFQGVNVPPHSITTIRLRFFVERTTDGALTPFADAPHLWREEGFPDLVLALRTVRHRRSAERAFGREPSSTAKRDPDARAARAMLNENAAPADPDLPHLERLVIVRAGSIKRTHADNVGELEVSYLTKPPAGRPALDEVPAQDRADFAHEDHTPRRSGQASSRSAVIAMSSCSRLWQWKTYLPR